MHRGRIDERAGYRRIFGETAAKRAHCAVAEIGTNGTVPEDQPRRCDDVNRERITLLPKRCCIQGHDSLRKCAGEARAVRRLAR